MRRAPETWFSLEICSQLLAYNTNSASNMAPTAPDNEPPRSKRVGRGKAWTPEEDLDLCKAWVKVSEDPKTGNGQKTDQFWKRIHATTKSSRSVRALSSRWSNIRHDVSKFCGLFEAAVKLDESGKNDEDRLNDCLAIFPEQAWNSAAQEFQYVECWQYLKEKPKWQFDQAATSKATQRKTKKRWSMSSASYREPDVDQKDRRFDAVWGDGGDDEPEPASDGGDIPQVHSFI